MGIGQMSELHDYRKRALHDHDGVLNSERLNLMN